MALTPEQRRRALMSLPDMARASGVDVDAARQRSDEVAAQPPAPVAPPRDAMLSAARGALAGGIDTLANQIPGVGPVSGAGAAVLRTGDAAANLLASQLPLGPTGDQPTPKEKAKADTAAIAQAATSAYHAGEPVGQPTVRPPAQPATTTMPKAGTGPAVTPQTPSAAPGTAPKSGADPHYANTVPVKMPDGRVIWSSPDRALELGKAGGQGIDRAMAIARSGNREDVTSQGQGAQVATGSAGSAFLRPSVKVQLPKPPDTRPYSAQVESLIGSMPEINLSEPGGSGFGLSPPGSGGATQGYRKLSGLEQATARREWLEKRADEERAHELAQAQQERQLAEAKVDPLEAARIRAMGQYGGEAAKVALDTEARRAAYEQYGRTHAMIEQMRNELAKTKPGTPEEARLKDEIDKLIQEARERAAILLGHSPTEPRPDLFAAMAGFTTPSGAPGTPTSGAR